MCSGSTMPDMGLRVSAMAGVVPPLL